MLLTDRAQLGGAGYKICRLQNDYPNYFPSFTFSLRFPIRFDSIFSLRIR